MDPTGLPECIKEYMRKNPGAVRVGPAAKLGTDAPPATYAEGVSEPAAGPTDVETMLLAVEQVWGKPETEYKFHGTRKWRFDYAWVEAKVAFEREGGDFRPAKCPKCGHVKTVFVSRHHSRDGLERDAEKYNAAQVLGWLVIRATPGMVKDGRALAALLEALRVRG